MSSPLPNPHQQYITPVSSTSQLMYAIPINPHPVPIHGSSDQPPFLIDQTQPFAKLTPELVSAATVSDVSKRSAIGIPNMFMNNITTHFDVMTSPSITHSPILNPLTSPTPEHHHISFSTEHHHHSSPHPINVSSEPNAGLLIIPHPKNELPAKLPREMEKLPESEKEEQTPIMSEVIIPPTNTTSQQTDLVVKSESQDQIELLKKLVSDIDDPSLLWNSVREKILARCQFWDLVLDKASLSYMYETKSKKIRREELELRRFEFVLREIECLLGEFKCFMDGCLQEDLDNLFGFHLSPEVSRLFGEDQNKSWRVKDTENINPLYAAFFKDDSTNAGEDVFMENFELEDNEQIQEEDEDSINQAKQPPKPLFNCSMCGKIYTRESNLVKHKLKCETQLLEPKEKIKVCPKDSATAGQIKKFEEEINSNSKTTIYNCDFCDFTTNKMNGLSLHKRRLHHLDKNNHSVTPQDDNPDYHNRDPKKFKHQCSSCSRRYKKIHHLDRHLIKCDGIPPPTRKPMWQKNEDGRFSCSVPGCTSEKTWTSSFSVWHHYNSIHADMQDDRYCVFKCDLCSDKFPNKSMLTRHRNHKHESLFRFQCSKCNKRLASNKLLKLHLIQHTGEKPYRCEYCDYKAITQSVLKQHKLRMHEGTIPDKVLPRHVCDICGKSFKVRSNLKEHMATHSDTRSFLCGICGKSLKNRQCLNRHLFTHGVKHTCPVCGKNFSTMPSLGIHKRDKHGHSI